MSHMPQLPRLAACPGCHEPLETGDNFCGGCGAELSVPPPSTGPDGAPAPTLPLNGVAHLAERAAAREAGPSPAEPDDYPLPPPNPPVASVSVSTAPPSPAAPSGAAAGGPYGGDAIGAGPYGGGGRDGATADPGPHGDERPAGAATVDGPAADPRAAAGVGATAPSGAEGTPTTGGPGGTGRRRCAACREGTIDRDGYCENCGHAQPRERDHMERELEGVAAASDRGLRHHRNEDAFAVSTTALPDGTPAVVAVVCDGVSSATRPDDASAAAAQAAGESLIAAVSRGTQPQQAMHDAIFVAAEAVNALAREPVARPEDHYRQNAPACTLVSAVAAGPILTVGWVGDSRAYWVPDDPDAPPARLTEDDSWAAQMVASGLMSEEEAYADERAHAITGWLGADAYELEPHTASFKPDRPGVVVVCTDGLWNYAESAREMARVVPADARTRPMESARRLVTYALEGGGHDNVTVAVVPFPVAVGRAGSA
ncbi:protein phosphatase 2C domain-containing protein [Streptomyces sp. LX-29]|uniref:PP2C family serine/threonine-protein phosphatase n=1 Tax=Streptomyces sp. LX-29 TaxID=2900152 RepID=UPI00240D00A4|nr:PP2C family serine/threonine-protein phosphatase [Streptomyces sp. LX-29]WFB11784.1 protein phosphatase 2C domain-containing protein [Streptomyces sp. LX-29]